MQKTIIFSLLVLSMFLFVGLKTVEARSGCCSYHSGVCGSSCCDGTPLSPICGGDSFIPLYAPPSSGTDDTNQALQWCGAGQMFATRQEADNSLSDYTNNIDASLTTQVNDLTSQLEIARGRQFVIFVLLILSLLSTLLGYKYKKWQVVTFTLLLLGAIIMLAMFE